MKYKELFDYLRAEENKEDYRFICEDTHWGMVEDKDSIEFESQIKEWSGTLYIPMICGKPDIRNYTYNDYGDALRLVENNKTIDSDGIGAFLLYMASKNIEQGFFNIINSANIYEEYLKNIRHKSFEYFENKFAIKDGLILKDVNMLDKYFGYVYEDLFYKVESVINSPEKDHMKYLNYDYDERHGVKTARSVGFKGYERWYTCTSGEDAYAVKFVGDNYYTALYKGNCVHDIILDELQKHKHSPYPRDERYDWSELEENDIPMIEDVLGYIRVKFDIDAVKKILESDIYSQQLSKIKCILSNIY